MPVSYALLASQVPTPIAVPTPTLGAPSTPFPTGQTYPPPGTSTVFNQVAAALALVCMNGGGGYGILTGLDLYQASTINVAVTNGIALGSRVVELVNAPAYGSAPILQVVNPGPYTLTDDAVNYVWLTNTGSLVAAVTTAYPVGAKWYLGAVTCAAGDITDIDYSGRITLSGGRFSRQTADIGAPADTPDASLELQTFTTTGRYLWNGAAHVFQPVPANVQTLSGDLILDALSPTEHFLKTDGSHRNVRLPDLATLPPGRSYTFVNYDAAKNIVIKDSTGATTHATLTPTDYSITIPTFLNTSGNVAVPSSFTPGPIAAGAATSGGSL